MGLSGLGQRIDGLFFDRTVTWLAQPPDQPGRTLAVLITEADYQAARTPLALWGLNLAPLLDKLAAAPARAVGIDLLLPRFPLRRVVKRHDRQVFKALKHLVKAHHTVSGYGITPGGGLQAPFLIYQRILGPSGLGYFNLWPDGDGVIRSQRLTLPADKGRTSRSFALLLADAEPPPGDRLTPDWRRPPRIERLSIAQALAADLERFRDRTVIIGADFTFEDRHLTPIGRLPGAVLQAVWIESLTTGRRLFNPGRLWSVGLPALVIIGLGFGLTRRGGPLRLTLTGLALAAGLGGGCAASLTAGAVFLPAAGWGGLIGLIALRLGWGVGFIKEAFGRYVTGQVRDEILAGRIPLDGETKEVTVLFSDLRGFTPLTESLPPKQVVKILNGYYDEMAGAIHANRGLVFQYVGDEIYAVFGAPAPLADHATWAVRAGLAMAERLKVYNQKLIEQGLPPLKNGIGVNTGPVVAANIGGGGRLKYALVGDTVNLGSRLEGLTKQFGVQMIVSGPTKTLVTDPVRFRALPETPIKGKSKPVEIFAVEIEG